MIYLSNNLRIDLLPPLLDDQLREGRNSHDQWLQILTIRRCGGDGGDSGSVGLKQILGLTRHLGVQVKISHPPYPAALNPYWPQRTSSPELEASGRGCFGSGPPWSNLRSP